MSRIWKAHIQIPSWVTVEVNNSIVTVKGPKGQLTQDIRDFVTLTQVDNELTVSITDENDSFQKWVWGLSRTLVNNMITWVTVWFEKSLEIIWVWYKFDVVGTNKLNLAVWFSHKVELIAPEWIKLEADATNKNMIYIRWIDKQLVGFFASKIRAIKKPEPYKGKWIRYTWEYVRRKAWKTWGKK